MLNLPKRKSTFNFYESFSDLVFCTLVMFLVLVLFLAVNVNQQAKQVKLEEQETRERLAIEIAQMETDRESARIELDTATQESEAAIAIRLEAERLALEAERLRLLEEARLAEQQALAQRQRQRYEEALGTYRFSDPPARPRLMVAYRWEERRILIHPVPAWFVAQLNTTPAGLTEAQEAQRQSAMRAQFLEIVEQAEPLTSRQYRALMRSMSVGIEPMTSQQLAMGAQLDAAFGRDTAGFPITRVAHVTAGGSAQLAGVLPEDVLIAIDGDVITPENLSLTIAKYRPGQAAQLLIQREGRPMRLDLVFRDHQLVQVQEQFRTDLSMVVSGALDAQYRYLWEPALADALRAKLQGGEAAQAVWQRYSRTEDQRAVPGRPVLSFDADVRRQEVIVGDQRFTPDQFQRILESLAGGGVVIEYAADFGPETIPAWLYDQCMKPTGFVNQAPRLDLLDGDDEEAEIDGQTPETAE